MDWMQFIAAEKCWGRIWAFWWFSSGW